MKLYKFENILNEIASVFDMDQWDEQVNTFTDIISTQLNEFVHTTEFDHIYILECSTYPKFEQWNFYKNEIYIDGEKVWLKSPIGTIYPGTIENIWRNKQKTVTVYIDKLDQLGESCKSMFGGCKSLVSVPWFDTSRVTDMSSMFYNCKSLVSVPKFNTNKVCTMYEMFEECPSLSEKTKKAWSSVYDFETHRKKRNEH